MKTRTIMIFPDFKNRERIEEIRKKFDPLSELVSPHITLVFPFESDIVDEEIKYHLYDKIKGMSVFEIVLTGITKEIDTFGNYLFLNVKEGKEKIIELHNIFYTGILKQYDMGYAYNPHMTIGKLQSVDELNLAYQEIYNVEIEEKIMINKIVVEHIGENGQSIIDMEYILRNQ